MLLTAWQDVYLPHPEALFRYAKSEHIKLAIDTLSALPIPVNLAPLEKLNPARKQDNTHAQQPTRTTVPIPMKAVLACSEEELRLQLLRTANSNEQRVARNRERERERDRIRRGREDRKQYMREYGRRYRAAHPNEGKEKYARRKASGKLPGIRVKARMYYALNKHRINVRKRAAQAGLGKDKKRLYWRNSYQKQKYAISGRNKERRRQNKLKSIKPDEAQLEKTRAYNHAYYEKTKDARHAAEKEQRKLNKQTEMPRQKPKVLTEEQLEKSKAYQKEYHASHKVEREAHQKEYQKKKRKGNEKDRAMMKEYKETNKDKAAE